MPDPLLAEPPPPSARAQAERRALAVVLIALALWGGVFIVRTSFVIGEERVFVLFDDSMISMAYARNVLRGEGLVWTPGSPPAEGFTNPLWTALMVPANAVPLPDRHVSAVIQVLGLLLMAATVWRVRALLRAHFPGAAASPAGWLPAAVLTASYYPLAYWSIIGMETPLQALLAVLAVHLAYDIVFADRDRHLALFVVFALAYLVRMDMAILVAVVGGWVAVHGGFRRRAMRCWLAGAAVLAATVGGYQLFRLLYFGEWLPNTYHLKIGEVPLRLRLPRGARQLGRFLLDHAAIAVVFAAGVAAGAGRRSRTLLPALLVFAYLAYSVWVGADAWEPPEFELWANRFVAFVLPLAFVVVGDLFNRLSGAWAPARRRAATAAATAALVMAANGLWPSSNAAARWSLFVHADYRGEIGSHANVLSRLRDLQGRVAPGALVATYWAGIPAFFADYRLIDAYGYNDPHIARRPVRDGVSADNYVPGHSKTDPAYVLAQRPDAFFQLWDLDVLPVAHPRHHMRRLGYAQVGDFWLRRDSPYLLPGAIPPPPPAPPRR